MFQVESSGETKKPETYAIYVEFLLPSFWVSFIIRKLILQELCQEELQWYKQVSEEYVKKW